MKNTRLNLPCRTSRGFHSAFLLPFSGGTRPHPGLLAVLFFFASVWPLNAAALGPDGNNLPEAAPAEIDVDALALPDAHGGHAGHAHVTTTRQQHQDFARKIDLAAFRKLAVFDNGTVKIVDTLAREHLTTIYGKPRWRDIRADTVDAPPKDREKFKYDPVFTYLDLVFDRGYYGDKPILYVEVLPFREQLIAHLPPQEREEWKKLGRISWHMFESPTLQAIYRGPETSRAEMNARNQLFTSANAFINVGSRLMMICPPPGEVQWSHIDGSTGDPAEEPSAEGASLPVIAESSVRAAQPSDVWAQLAGAWRARDAETVNTLLATLVDTVPAVHPETYPPAYRLSLERLYNVTGKFTIGYWLYALATVAMILALGTGRKTLLAFGVSLLLLGLLAHTGSFAIRAVLTGRWAIHNQYESFIAISLFAVFAGVVLMFAKKVWVFGAAAAAMGTISLLIANLWAIPSNEVGQVAAILATSRILYVHVNMVLVSYGLIALSFFVSLTYLFAHYVKTKQSAAFAIASVGNMDTAQAIGDGDGDGKENLRGGRKKLLADLDQAQLTLMQLAFWLLGVGIMLGAYWADHSWGRWWAWDPKETWSLITWIVYLIAIHVRFGVRNRGLVTAWLSVVGFIVMLWTYWGVNLLLAGLHSYA